MLRPCRRCGGDFETDRACRLYCSARCRRLYQNERRREERAEQAALRESWDDTRLTDPWARNDLDEEGMEAIWANALLDPLPAGLADDIIGGPMASMPPPRPRLERGWKKNWLRLC